MKTAEFRCHVNARTISFQTKFMLVELFDPH